MTNESARLIVGVASSTSNKLERDIKRKHQKNAIQNERLSRVYHKNHLYFVEELSS